LTTPGFGVPKWLSNLSQAFLNSDLSSPQSSHAPIRSRRLFLPRHVCQDRISQRVFELPPARPMHSPTPCSCRPRTFSWYRHPAVRSLGLSSRASLALPHRATSLGEQGRAGPELPLKPRAFLGKLRGTPESVRRERHDTDESFRIALATLHSLLAYTRARQI
jgi:hypothetical protein